MSTAFKKSLLASTCRFFRPLSYLFVTIACVFTSTLARSQTSNAEAIQKSNDNVAFELTNPLSNLQLFSLQWNHNRGLGANQAGTSQTFQISPKVKVDISEDWKSLTRVYVNGTKLQNVNGVNNSGLGPTQIETFFAPRSSSETIYGIGPYFQMN